MPIVIKEYLGSNVDLGGNKTKGFSLTESTYVDNQIAEDSVMVDIEGIHVGPTRNYTWYTDEALKTSIPTWTTPYQRPLILHHNEKDGKIIGRVLAADYKQTNTRSNTGALIFTCNVPDEEGKRGIKDGTLKTVSIGVIAHDVRCSICGQVISEYGECEHERGGEYEGQTCYWMIYKMEAKELSYVIVPSDIYAHNIRTYSAKEEINKKSLKEGVASMSKVNIKEGLEDKDIAEGAKDAVINEDAEKAIAPVESKKEEPKVEPKEEPKVEPEDNDEILKDTVDRLKQLVIDLEAKVKDSEDEVKKATELREAAEQELVNTNIQLKELMIEQIFSLREQLKRPMLIKENLVKRNLESLLDSINDLKEEMSPSKGKVDIAEATSVTEDAVEIKPSKGDSEIDNVSKITKVVNESLTDEKLDSSAKNDDILEKNKNIDVKESVEHSNSEYEAAMSAMKFYNI